MLSWNFITKHDNNDSCLSQTGAGTHDLCWSEPLSHWTTMPLSQCQYPILFILDQLQKVEAAAPRGSTVTWKYLYNRWPFSKATPKRTASWSAGPSTCSGYVAACHTTTQDWTSFCTPRTASTTTTTMTSLTLSSETTAAQAAALFRAVPTAQLPLLVIIRDWCACLKHQVK